MSDYDSVVSALEKRGFTRMDFDMEKIRDLMDVLGSPQRAYPAIHLTGTNGKTSTARMIDSLLRAFGIHTGRYTSPHLETVRERISLYDEPIDDDRFVSVYREVEPLAALVDQQHDEPLTYFDMTTALAFAAFADAPVDVAVVEVDRPNRQERRRKGKTDVIDAIEAARAAQGERQLGSAKTRDGNVEAIRALVVANSFRLRGGRS